MTLFAALLRSMRVGMFGLFGLGAALSSVEHTPDLGPDPGQQWATTTETSRPPAGGLGSHLAPSRQRCNGYDALCDRRVDHVTFASTHNAMNAASQGWLWPNQSEDIPAQLERGIRGFLIDTHYWETAEQTASYRDRLTPGQRTEFGAAAWQPADGERLYLCHVMCAMGNVTLVSALRAFDRFLAAHPDEVVILDIEDHISRADTEAAFRESGMLRRVYTRAAGTPWPTLRKLIAQDRRVIVLAERSGAPSSWYGRMYDDAWDTPYGVRAAADFDCQPTRGKAGNSLLLMNHWIAKRVPDPADAASVNRYDALMAHASRCIAEQAKVPNLVAVDFASIGDLQRVVAALNGVSDPPDN